MRSALRTDEPSSDSREDGMARVSVLEKHRLTPQLAKYAERASVTGRPSLSNLGMKRTALRAAVDRQR